MRENKLILFVVNVDWFLISHRFVLCKEALAQGYQVSVACSDTGHRSAIEAAGVKFIDLPIDRSGTNPINEFKTIRRFSKLYKDVKPDLVHHITLKPVVYGSIAARRLKIPVVNAVSGLGYNLSESNKGIAKYIMVKLMRYGFRGTDINVIFQNHDDRNALKALKITNRKNKIWMIKGAGVDLKEFAHTPVNTSFPLKVILPARMLWDKGIKEFKQASELLYQRMKGKLIFQLIGRPDKDNKAGADMDQLKAWQVQDYFEFLDYQEDMVSVYKSSSIVVLPSYREGMPKSLLEACAIGRPIVTTTAIGCRECVDQGVNGYKVEVKDFVALAQRIEEIANDSMLMKRMAKAGRIKAEKEFDLEIDEDECEGMTTVNDLVEFLAKNFFTK